MSFSLLPSHPDSALKCALEEITLYDLKARCSISVPPLSFATVPHGVEIKTNGVVLLVPAENVLITYNVVVLTGIVADGETATGIFNLSNESIRIKKGQVLSWLVSL